LSTQVPVVLSESEKKKLFVEGRQTARWINEEIVKILETGGYDVSLLKKVADFKNKFYRSNRARYDQATLKEILLIPSEIIIDQLEKDYEVMTSMIYGEVIPLRTILEGLDKLLKEIRELEV
jgi:hypothetical protein